MYEWRYKSGEAAPAFILAADARCITTNYYDDQIWELVPGRSEPPAVTIQTTYGLRVRDLRIYPRFGAGGNMVSDPAEFPGSLVIRQMGPAWIQALFEPLNGLKVQCDFYIAHTQALSGRILLTNTSEKVLPAQIELAAVLSPAGDGERMHPAEMGLARVLTGKSGGLYPLLFISGGARQGRGVFASLEQAAEIEPGESSTLRWVCTACDSPEKSLDLARKLALQNPDEILARLEMLDQGLLQIRTGNLAWNQALSRVQIKAYSLLQSPTDHLPNTSFVYTRRPDNGFSLRGDGTDYGPLWNGQTALAALYLSQFFLPSDPEIARGILENFFAARHAGGVDWKPGLGGQRSQFLATPLLASLAWDIYTVTEDLDFLTGIFPNLLEAFLAWFTPEQDRDGDGIPEWSNPLQTGLEDHPVFAHWLDGAPGLEISTVESPDLLSFLYQEGELLRRMAILVDQKAALNQIQPRLRALKKTVIHCWDGTLQIFNPRDRDTHLVSRSELLGAATGGGTISINRKFRHPVRLRVSILTAEGQTRRAEGSIRGTVAGFNPQKASGAESVEEALPAQRFRWRPGAGQSTSQAVFTAVDEVLVANIDPKDEVRVETVEHVVEDISGLLPVWAALPGEKQVQEMCSKALLNPDRFGRPHGIPNSALPAAETGHSTYNTISLPWNMLILRGLLAYGLRSEASVLLTRIMDTCTSIMAREGTFRRFYNADSGSGSGERGALEGLPPLGLFLEVLGVRVYSPRRVRITGENPFPWPVTVRYRGLTVMRQKAKTTVIFPDGQTTTVSGSGTYEVTL